MRTGRASRAASMNADGDEWSRGPSGFETIVASIRAEWCDVHHLSVVKAESRSRFWGWAGTRKASRERQAYLGKHERRVCGFGTGSCGHAHRGITRERDCAVGGAGAERGALGLQTLLAGGAPLDCRAGRLG